jgi:hypothetical protein
MKRIATVILKLIIAVMEVLDPLPGSLRTPKSIKNGGGK